MRDYLTKTGPVPFRIEALRVLLTAVLLMAIPLVTGGDRSGYRLMLLILLGVIIGIASRYVRWHFHPYKEPTIQ